MSMPITTVMKLMQEDMAETVSDSITLISFPGFIDQ